MPFDVRTVKSKADIFALADQRLMEIARPDKFGGCHTHEIINAAEDGAKRALRWGTNGFNGCMIYMLTDEDLSWGYVGQGLRVCPKTSGGITKFSEHEAD